MGTWALYFEVLFGMIGSLGHNFIYQLTRCQTPHTVILTVPSMRTKNKFV